MTSMSKPENEAKIAAMFDKVAPRYDFLNALLSMRQDHRWRRQLLELCPKNPNGKYLDIATGTGDVLHSIADQRPDAHRLVGVDISQKMLDLAQQKVANNPSRKKCQWHQMSAEHLDFEADTFDCLSISFGLRNVVNKENAIAEFHKVLKKGGSLLVLEFFTSNENWFNAVFQFYFHSILPKIGAIFSDKDAYEYLPKSVGSFYSYPSLCEKLESNGFHIGSTFEYLFGSCRLIEAKKI